MVTASDHTSTYTLISKHMIQGQNLELFVRQAKSSNRKLLAMTALVKSHT